MCRMGDDCFMITGYNHFGDLEKITAEKNQWMIFSFRNFSNVIELLIELSNNLKCVICKDLSLNYIKKSSLAEHYRTYHKRKTAEYFIKTIVPLTPDQLKEKFEEIERLSN